ncbi:MULTISPECIES: 50S ribosomal protein L11 methyltransferase [unclassified Bradyrhizobium]
MGCGSGMHALAALSLGAASVLAVDSRREFCEYNAGTPEPVCSR